MPEAIPTDQVLANARAAVEEIRRHVDHQADAGAAVDTLATALVAVVVGGVGLAVPRLHLGTIPQTASAALGAIAVLALTYCIYRALRPEDGFSYGADPGSLARLVDRYSEVDVALALVDSLVRAREKNVAYLGRKQRFVAAALGSVVLSVLAGLVMLGTGAIQ